MLFAVPWRVALLGSMAIVGFDAAAATAANAFAFEYALAFPGSLLIYGLVGFAAGRTTTRARAAALAAGLVAFIEATVGWGVSWLIGPGRRATAEAPEILVTIVAVTLLGVLVGAVSGKLGRRSAVAASAG